MRVTQAHRQIQLVGDMEDIVSESREILTFLIVDVENGALVIDRGEIVETRKDQRGRSTKCTRSAIGGLQGSTATSAQTAGAGW